MGISLGALRDFVVKKNCKANEKSFEPLRTWATYSSVGFLGNYL